MGQIVFNGQKPKYCNLTAITTGSKKDYVIPAGEVWLIDSTNTSKSDGTGKYDYYIIGDDSKTASQLAADKVRIDDNDEIVIDNAPTSGSTHAVSSGGVYQAIQDIDVTEQISGKADKSEMSVVAGTGANADKTTITLKSGTSATVLTTHQDISGKQNTLTFDIMPTTNSTNPVTSGGIKSALDAKQDTLIFDSAPTANSIKPVTSGGVKSALDGKADAITTYTKSEVNNLIVPANTEISVVSELPASGQANTIYRVPGSNSYADYGWDGTQFVKLAEYATAYSGRVWY